MELISIICVSYGRPQLLLKAMQSCVQQNYPNLEFIVLLNGGCDQAEKQLALEMPFVKIIRTHRNLGAFPARNIAIANASGDFIFCIDDDAYFLSDDVISKLAQAFEREPQLAAAGCNIEGPTEDRLHDKDRYIHVFKGGAVLLRKEVFTDWVGYYSDLFFRAGAETYLSSALWDQGRRIKCIASARMYHSMAMTGRSDHAWWFYGLRSQNLCAVMREPGVILPLSLFSKFWKSFLHFAKAGKLMIWVHAWGSTLVLIPQAISSRRPIQFSTYLLLRKMMREELSSIEDLNNPDASRGS